MLLSCAMTIASFETEPQPCRLPSSDLDLVLQAPIKTWDEGIPLGSGLLGGLLWGGGSTLNVSLDRGDLWDERSAKGMQWEKFTYRNLVDLVEKKDRASIDDIFERAYSDVHPSKLPGGRLVIDLGSTEEIKSFRLSLADAMGKVSLASGKTIEALWSGKEQAGVFFVPGDSFPTLKLMTPAMVAAQGAASAGPDSHGVKALGYPDAEFGSADGLTWYVQEAAQGLRYVALAGVKRVKGGSRIAVTLCSTLDGRDPLSIAKKKIKIILNKEESALKAPHQAWWKKFWSASRLEVPDKQILSHYALVRYFYGAASRQGSPPMPLQGVWTADAGMLPPWKGDYHNDLNTQMTYMAYQAAGQFESGLSYLDFLWDRRERFRRFAREFYGTDGLSTPGVMTLAGEPLGGWVQYSLSPTMTAWSAHLFYLHWRHTGDDSFMKDRAYPWCREAALCLEALLAPDETGRLVLPTSSSPEIYDNSDRAWMKPNTNYDLMSLRMLFLSLVEMSKKLGKNEEADHWQDLSDRLGPYHMTEQGALKLNEVEILHESHRHLSNLMGIHPFNLITVEGGPGARRTIEKSLADWDRLGTRAWCGYSFSWMSALRARAGQAEEAHRLLNVFTSAFILRNGFHANGDQSGRGYSGFTYRPFTLEGNFLAMHALQEMLLQSWSPTPGLPNSEVIRIFPAVTSQWKDASFQDLRAEGGHKVSAERRQGSTTWFSINPKRSGVLRVKDTFAGAAVDWSVKGVVKKGDVFEVPIKAGKMVKAVVK